MMLRFQFHIQTNHLAVSAAVLIARIAAPFVVQAQSTVD